MHKAFVLLSGGMDSTTCLHKAIADCGYDASKVEAVSIDYGQRHLKETQYATATCKKLGVQRTLLSCSSLAGDAMLTNPDAPIPSIDYADIKGVSPTYVPFRNGTLLSVITAHAQKWVNAQIAAMLNNPSEKAKLMTDSVGIYFGAHAEDAANWAYPDCTPEFIGAMANAIYIGTYQAVRLITPLQWLTKKDIVRLGQELHVDWKGTWSCYAGGEKHCGVCPTCRARKTAFKQAEISDPTIYAE
jgi:7-cyano-7-deazaguanine synthase